MVFGFWAEGFGGVYPPCVCAEAKGRIPHHLSLDEQTGDTGNGGGDLQIGIAERREKIADSAGLFLPRLFGFPLYLTEKM